VIPDLAPRAPKRTASEMYSLLEAHYAPPPSKPPGGRLLKEIQAPHSTRRADALYLPITTGGRGTIIGHEIKVARSDVLAELRDPHKADSWLRYCTRWWLVVSDPSFIDGLDVPESWGVMAPPTKGRFMTIIRKAPPLTPHDGHMAEAWGTVFARVAYADIAVEANARHWEKQVQSLGTTNRELQAEVARLTSIVDGDRKGARARIAVADVLAAVERLGGYGDDAAPGLSGGSWNVDAERVARWILAEVKIDDRRDLDGDIRMAINSAERTLEGLRSVLKSVQ
jgi:hypothetical protein